MRPFHLCFHDFSAKNAALAERQVRRISDAAGCPLSVAVIPQTENAGSFAEEAFRRRVEALENAGHEILLHGARHFDDGRFPRNPWGKIALKLTAGEAEFAGLGRGDSSSLLDEAVEFWHRLRMDLPKAFVPPAWYGNCHLKSQVLSRFDFYEDRFAVYKRDCWIFSPALSFAGLPSASLGFAFAFAKFSLKSSPGVPRLVFHPVDFETVGEVKILELVRWAASRRTRIPYARGEGKRFPESELAKKS